MTIDYCWMAILLAYSASSDDLLAGWVYYFSLILPEAIGYLTRYKNVEHIRRVIFYHLFL